MKRIITIFITIIFVFTYVSPIFAKTEATCSDEIYQQKPIARATFDSLKTGEADFSKIVKLFPNNSMWIFYTVAQFFLGKKRVHVVESDGQCGKYLKVKYPKGEVRSKDSGAQWKWSVPDNQELYLSYWIKFDPDFEFVKGGKLPGFCGGSCNAGGDKPNGKDGWSARLMWQPEGGMIAYVYHKNQATDYGDSFHFMINPPKIYVSAPENPVAGSCVIGSKTNPSCFDLSKEIRLEKGRWYKMTEYVKVNNFGKKDGAIKAWIDGSFVLDVEGFEFRSGSYAGGNPLLIDTVFFSTFFGGNEKTWAPGKDVYSYFDDFTVSKYPLY